MKTGEAAKILGIDVATIRRWIERDEITNFFSDGARSERGSTQRLLTESDVLVLNTVLALRTRERMTDWSDIVAYLNSGQREQEFPQNAISGDPRTIPLQQAEQSAKAMATLAERDSALAKVRELESQITRLENKNAEQNAEIIRLNREIGRLEGLLEALRDEDK